MVVCKNEEYGLQEIVFSSVADLKHVKLIKCLSLQGNWSARQLEFDNAFQVITSIEQCSSNFPSMIKTIL